MGLILLLSIRALLFKQVSHIFHRSSLTTVYKALDWFYIDGIHSLNHSLPKNFVVTIGVIATRQGGDSEPEIVAIGSRSWINSQKQEGFEIAQARVSGPLRGRSYCILSRNTPLIRACSVASCILNLPHKI